MKDLPSFYRSQVAKYNDDAHGHWLILDASVYDVSELMRTHPGGARILQLYAGRDATHGFRRVGHEQSRVQHLLAQARIGTVRELECTTRADHGAHSAAAHVLQRALALAIEMQNALSVDHSFQLERLHGPAAPSRFELQRGLVTHARFHREYVDVLIHGSLGELASSILAPEGQRASRARCAQLQSSQFYTDARAGVLEIIERIEAFADQELTVFVACCEVLNGWLLRMWKHDLSRAIRALEGDHAATLRPSEAHGLDGVCDRLWERLSEYFRHAAAITRTPRLARDVECM